MPLEISVLILIFLQENPTNLEEQVRPHTLSPGFTRGSGGAIGCGLSKSWAMHSPSGVRFNRGSLLTTVKSHLEVMRDSVRNFRLNRCSRSDWSMRLAICQ